MFELTFFVPVLIVAGVWGFFLLNFAGNNRRILDDDIVRVGRRRTLEIPQMVVGGDGRYPGREVLASMR